MYKTIILIFTILYTLVSCKNSTDVSTNNIINESTRVVSLNGTFTEILCALGYEKNLVGVDITSTYPESIQHLSKTGHTRDLSAESIIEMNPQLVFAFKDEIKPEVQNQLESAKIKLLLMNHPNNVKEAKELIKSVADTLNVIERAKKIIDDIDKNLDLVQPIQPRPKVLFIYARGAGTLLVAGDNTPIGNIIQSAGGMNAVTGFNNFKQLSSEMLIEINPDAVLVFESGLSSLNGIEGMKNITGMSKINAYLNNAYISMDGQFLSGMGPRIGEAILELNKKLQNIKTNK
ncbi:MAG: ABC transporter substrate-binding protein [Chitinophagales bacterium]|nr:ABC transporter substrate-binding protein [Chitinophagales bacterium]